MRAPDGGGSSDEEKDSDEEEEEADEDMEGGVPQPEPDSFSRVDMSAEPAQLTQQFPDFPGAAAALTVEVNAGVGMHIRFIPAVPFLLYLLPACT